MNKFPQQFLHSTSNYTVACHKRKGLKDSVGLGVGTIYCDDEGPKLHIPTAIGKDNQTLVGCPRGGAKTFLILEVTIIEIEGLKARRKPDKNTGLNLLRFK